MTSLAQHPTSRAFRANATAALQNKTLQQAMRHLGFKQKRLEAVNRLPEFEALREEARALKNHTLEHLDFYLEAWEAKVLETGGQVHWCRTPEEARQAILNICRAVDARSMTKGKTMVAEEIALNPFLEAHGIAPVETDLGEYIIQLRDEPPSHIIAPAIHLTKEQVADSFHEKHAVYGKTRLLTEPREMLEEARGILREKFLAAEVGLTGANMLIAETGSSVIVTNEGNGDLTQLLPRVHIVLATPDKLVPSLADACTVLRLLARSATGQEFSVYTTVSTGPRRGKDGHGPEQYHVVMLDNGRTAMLGTAFQDMLRCIRCSACLNHCPVYNAVGGHAYGWVYPGPMGSVLTPGLIGVDQAGALPNASTFCGKCESVCPMKIPLPKMMRHWREREYEQRLSAPVARWGLAVWAFAATRPRLYRWIAGCAARVLGMLGRRHGNFANLPLAGGWTEFRDLPAPEGRSFHQAWKARAR